MNIHKIHKYALIVIGILVIVLLYLCFLLVQQYQHTRSLEEANHDARIFELMHRDQKPLTSSDVTSIASWMTFDFINRIFHVPSSYLQNALQISDINYPNISIQRYASTHGLNVSSLVGEVQMEIGAYVGPKTSVQ